MVEADPDFVYSVVSRMRERDFEEVRATGYAHTREQIARNLVHLLSVKQGMHITRGFAHQGLPAAVFGVVEMWPGVWSAWMMATDDWPKVALSATKHILRKGFPSVWKKGAHRIEARSVAGYVQAHRWMKMMGAHEEAVLVGFGRNGEDFKVFVWRRHV